MARTPNSRLESYTCYHPAPQHFPGRLSRRSLHAHIDKLRGCSASVELPARPRVERRPESGFDRAQRHAGACRGQTQAFAAAARSSSTPSDVFTRHYHVATVRYRLFCVRGRDILWYGATLRVRHSDIQRIRARSTDHTEGSQRAGWPERSLALRAAPPKDEDAAGRRGRLFCTVPQRSRSCSSAPQPPGDQPATQRRTTFCLPSPRRSDERSPIAHYNFLTQLESTYEPHEDAAHNEDESGIAHAQTESRSCNYLIADGRKVVHRVSVLFLFHPRMSIDILARILTSGLVTIVFVMHKIAADNGAVHYGQCATCF
jgi:hypothetical protein